MDPDKLAVLSKLTTSSLLMLLAHVEVAKKWWFGGDAECSVGLVKLALSAVSAEIDRRFPVPA